MSNESARSAIESRFQTQWALGTYSSVPVQYPNTPFTPPSQVGVDSGPWCRISVLPSTEYQASFGTSHNTYRILGTIFINVMVPPATGGGDVSKIADSAAAIFRGQKFGGVQCLSATVSNLGEDPKGWYVNTVKISYRYDFNV